MKLGRPCREIRLNSLLKGGWQVLWRWVSMAASDLVSPPRGQQSSFKFGSSLVISPRQDLAIVSVFLEGTRPRCLSVNYWPNPFFTSRPLNGSYQKTGHAIDNHFTLAKEESVQGGCRSVVTGRTHRRDQCIAVSLRTCLQQSAPVISVPCDHYWYGCPFSVTQCLVFTPTRASSITAFGEKVETDGSGRTR